MKRRLDLDFDDDAEYVAESATDANMTDQERRNFLAFGVPLVDLCAIFGHSQQSMKKLLAGINPAGTRGSKLVYRITDVAQRVLTPSAEQVAEAVRRMEPTELPALLMKAFWSGQRERQRWEEEAGMLWNTDRVLAVVAEIMRIVRQRLILGTEQIDRMAPLNDQQRMLVQGVFDGTIAELQHLIKTAFADYDGRDDKPRSPHLALEVPANDDTEDDFDLAEGL